MNILKRVIFALVIAVIVILMLFPFLWMLMSAFKTQVDIIAWPPRFVFTPTLRNFERVFVEQNFLLYLKNSMIVCATTIPIALSAAGTLWRTTLSA